MSAHTPLAILLELSEENRLTSDDFTRALSAAKVRATKPGAAPTKFADGGGLTLYIPPSGAKVWRYRYRLGGKEQILTVGAYPDVSLEHARVAHRAARWLVARGIHPLSYAEREVKRRAAEAQAFDEHTFQVIAEKWQQATAANLAPRTVKHRRAGGQDRSRRGPGDARTPCRDRTIPHGQDRAGRAHADSGLDLPNRPSVGVQCDGPDRGDRAEAQSAQRRARVMARWRAGSKPESAPPDGAQAQP